MNRKPHPLAEFAALLIPFRANVENFKGTSPQSRQGDSTSIGKRKPSVDQMLAGIARLPASFEF